MLGEQTAKLYMPTLPLFEIPPKSPLVGIARLASEGESLREGHEVEYFTLPAKSLLNRCVSRRGLPFTWKPISGLNIPLVRHNKQNGEDSSMAEYTTLELNPSVDPKIFEKPAEKPAAQP
jgi:hypothetical protein